MVPCAWDGTSGAVVAGMTSRHLPGLVLSFSLFACASDPSPSSDLRGRCIEERDHAIDLELERAQAAGAVLTPEVEEQHRSALRVALGDSYLDECVQRGGGEVQP